jgi:hypothetical protein
LYIYLDLKKTVTITDMSSQAKSLRAQLLAQAQIKVKKGTTTSSTSLITPVKSDPYIFWLARPDRALEHGAADATTETRLARLSASLHRVIVACCCSAEAPDAKTGTDFSRLRAWRTLIGTEIHLSLSGVTDRSVLAGSLKLLSDDQERLLESFLTEVIDYKAGSDISTWEAEKEGKRASIQVKAAECAQSLGFPPVGQLSEGQIKGIRGSGHEVAKAALGALMVYLAGRPVVKRSAGISEKRPKNLQDKYNRGVVWPEIGGSVKMSLGAIRYIGDTWELDVTFRSVFVRALIDTTSETAGMIGSVFGTMVILLEYAQMSHVKVIDDFLEAYPFVIDIPDLAGEIEKYTRDMVVWAQTPARERLYIKMIRRDMIKLFNSRDFLRLTRLALRILSSRNKTLDDYEGAADTDVSGLEDRFHEYKRRYYGEENSEADSDEENDGEPAPGGN